MKDLKTAIDHNLATICAAIKSPVSISYQGSSDSTDGTEIKGDDRYLSKEILIEEESSSHCATLEEGLQIITDQLQCFHKHYGYWNNSGGYGKIKFSSKGEVRYTHVDYIYADEYCAHTWKNGDTEETYKGSIRIRSDEEKRVQRAKAQKAAIQSNWKEIFSKNPGLAAVTWTYSGMGDSGEGLNDISTKGEHGTEVAVALDAPVYRIVDVPEMQEHQTFYDLISQLTYQLVEFHGHTGFEINEGGGGEISVLKDEINYRHYDAVTTEESFSYVWNKGVWVATKEESKV